MKYYAISADNDTLVGLRLAGIEGELATTKREVEAVVNKAAANEEIAVLVITESCYEMSREHIDVIKLSALRPLVSVIPSATGRKSGKNDYITRLIREAIGIKI